jgi:hypothetical protein
LLKPFSLNAGATRSPQAGEFSCHRKNVLKASPKKGPCT